MRVAQDRAYQNAQVNSDRQNAKLEHDKALNRVFFICLSLSEAIVSSYLGSKKPGQVSAHGAAEPGDCLRTVQREAPSQRTEIPLPQGVQTAAGIITQG